MGKINFYFLSLLSATPDPWHLPVGGFYASHTLDAGTTVTPLWEEPREHRPHGDAEPHHVRAWEHLVGEKWFQGGP